MDEIFPLLGGVILGLAASQFQPKLRWAVVGLIAPFVALTASKISGELELDWRFVVLDLAEVALAAVAATAVVAWQRRASRTA
jgi:hypothetical protein